MWSIRRWCLALVSSIVILSVWATTIDEARLRVSVRQEGLQRGSSCIHLLAQVEIVNLDISEPITIRSIQARPEETIFNVPDRDSFDEKEFLPAQFQVLRLQQGGLTLQPNSVALVPLTFLPRYPHLKESSKKKKRNGRSNKPRPTLQRGDSSDDDHDAPVLSDSNVYNLEDLNGDDNLDGGGRAQRNNIGQRHVYGDGEYKVRATLVVDTSRGQFDYPVTATTVRKNDYDVPDTIIFFDESPRDCYHLHISNPSATQQLEVREIMVSRADSVSVQHDIVYSRESSRDGIRRGWSAGGPFIISPGAREVYVASICAIPRGAPSLTGAIPEGFSMDAGVNEVSLGYLQVRTDRDTLFIILERERRSDATNVIRTDDFLSDVNKMIQEFEDQDAQIGGYNASSTSLPKPERGNPLHSLDPRFRADPAFLTAISAVPSKAEFLIVTSTASNAVIKLALRNDFSQPVKLMVAKSMLMVTELAPQTTLKMNVTFGSPIDDACERDCECAFVKRASDMKPIPPGCIAKDMMLLSCSVGPDLSSLGFGPARRAVSFNGTIVVRASANLSMSYEEWSEQAKINPDLEPHLRLEIPYTVYVTDGMVDFVMEDAASFEESVLTTETPVAPHLPAISALFFPMYKARGKEFSSTAETFDRRLKVFSPMSLSVDKSRVAIRGSGDSRLCNRFQTFFLTGIGAADTRIGTQVFHLGTIGLKYVPKTSPKFGAPDVVVPQKCYLEVSTNPIRTGSRLPLLIYSGMLEASTFERIGDNSSKKRSATNESSAKDIPRGGRSTSVSGYDNVLASFQSSFSGLALFSTLGKLYPGKEQALSNKCTSTSTTHESYLLCRYLLDLTNFSDRESSHLDPILIEHGAVGHGEVKTTPLYMTNHNPVPVELFVDAARVEGTSITLGLDSAREKGDGSSPLDYLPFQDVSSNEKVSSGRWAGHSFHGLRQVLASTEKSMSWFANFAQKDAVALSRRAVETEPLLRKAYKESATVRFHRNQVDQCVSPVYQPSNGAENMFRDQRSFGRDGRWPLLLSADQQRLYPLGTVYNSSSCFATKEESPKRIEIPPGGVARLDVKVRGPPKESLHKDVSPFISTGVMLSTSFGQVMPIISSFEALVGQLQFTHVPATSVTPECAVGKRLNARNNENVVSVPPSLFRRHDSESFFDDRTPNDGIIIFPEASAHSSISTSQLPLISGESRNISLYLNSSFSREVRLRKVESCNPWFQVLLRRRDDPVGGDGTPFVPGRGVQIGTVHSSISCLPHQPPGAGQHVFELGEFPSFYHCALSWLESRPVLQPRGCGVELTLDRTRRWNDVTEDEVLSRAKSALKKAVAHLDEVYGGWKRSNPHPLLQKSDLAAPNSVQRKDGDSVTACGGSLHKILTLEKVDLFADLTESWNAVSELGFNKVSSSLRATIDYSYSDSTNGTESCVCHGRNDGKKCCEAPSNEADTRSLNVAMNGLHLETTLSTPRLFDCTRSKQRTRRPKTSGDEVLSVLDFPSALVSNVVALTIPIRNPTAVPVKVRLSSTPTAAHENSEWLNDPAESSSSVSGSALDGYLMSQDAAFVQNGHSSSSRTNAMLWWDGVGGFFLPDENGNIIQSHHNVTITAGAGAHVSLVNPSLHGSSAFLMGCGRRCGDRDMAGVNQGMNYGRNSESMPIELSPFGASAASGTTLLGRPSLNAQFNGVQISDPVFSAGGAIPSRNGPSAFAIPYSSQGEVIVPPYGEMELGPVYFRPPGRRPILGCDFSTEKGSHYAAADRESCRMKYFESMVFLENSLNGLERVLLRGKGLWERVVFLDAGPDSSTEEVVGDIENRHGRETLMFSGTGHRKAGRSHDAPVVKGVVVHNAGDVQVDFSAVYFSDASVGTSRGGRDATKPFDEYPKMLFGIGHSSDFCSYRNFRLLGCSDDQSVQVTGKKGKRSLSRGFRLLPGHNRTLFIEHRPDCTFRQEYVTLNFEYRRSSAVDLESIGNYSVSASGNIRHSKANNWERSFRKRKAELFVGFSMSKSEMADCRPVVPFEEKKNNRGILGYKLGMAARPSEMLLSGAEINVSFTVEYLRTMAAALAIFVLGTFVFHGVSVRNKSCFFFCSALRGNPYNSDIALGSSEDGTGESSGVSSVWSAAFRCLARTDPSSPELQALGREQIRQVVLNRYKSMGVLSPQCMSSVGGFQRERPGSGGGSVVKNGGKEGSIGGNEKIRTLSDSIFSNCTSFSAVESFSFSDAIPCGLGWRAAVSRGIIHPSSVGSLNDSTLQMKTTDLLQRRNSLQKKDEEKVRNGRGVEAMKLAGAVSATVTDTSGHSRISKSDMPLAITETVEKVTGNAPLKDSSLQVAAASNAAEEKFTRHERREKKKGQKQTRDGIKSTPKRSTPIRDSVPSGMSLKQDLALKSKQETGENNAAKGAPASSDWKRTGSASIPKQRNAAREKVKPAQQKPKRRRDRNRKEETDEPIVVDGVSVGAVKGNSKLSKKGESVDQSGVGDRASRASKDRFGDARQEAVSSSSRIIRPSSSTPEVLSPRQSELVTSPTSSWSPSASTSSSGIRPPPGLAPPPGFQSSDSREAAPTMDSFDLDLPAVPSIQKVVGTDFVESPTLLPRSDDKPYLKDDGDDRSELSNPYFSSDVASPLPGPVMSPPLGAKMLATSDLSLSPLAPPKSSIPIEERVVGKQSPADGKPLLGLGGGFNVMDFLDSILDDADGAEGETHGNGGSEDLQGTGPRNPLLQPMPSYQGERKSRAAAYGIAVEETSEDVPVPAGSSIVHSMLSLAPDSQPVEADYVNSMVDSFELLTPADLMGASQTDNGDAGSSQHGRTYKRKSFHASLLDE